MTHILIVEDEPEISKVLEMYLRGAGYDTERSEDGEQALDFFNRLSPDLVLLDINLPKRDGIEVLKHIRTQSMTPVIMLTARSEELDELLGLELGADDYITKPFRPRNVIARVKAVLRRSEGRPEAGAVLKVGALQIDSTRHTATVDGDRLELTATEFALLLHMAAYPNRVFSRLELLEAVLPESDALERVIDTHLQNVRRKLADTSAETLIETVRGVGYRLVEAS